MKDNEFKISHSQYKMFDRCPLSFWFNQGLGLEPRDQYKSLALRQGFELQRVLSQSGGEPAQFFEGEELVPLYIKTLINYIRKFSLLPEDVAWEVRCEKDGIVGTMDLFKDSWLGEIKFTASPDWYYNNFIAFDQLETYFYLKDEARRGFMLPIRVPGLKRKVKEDECDEAMGERFDDDLWKRASHYFPGLDTKRPDGEPKWGRVYGHLECDKDEVKKKVAWTIGEIRNCCKAGYWPYRRNCFVGMKNPCDYMSICTTRTINDDIYVRKERDDLWERK